MQYFFTLLTFYPTLAWNMLWGRLFKLRRWWDEVDQHVIIGALPLPGDPEALHQLGVRAVINTCREYGGPMKQYQDLGIEQLHTPTIDFTPPTLDHIEQAVEFIERYAEKGEKVYVHCKAGRGRSATVVLCWLISSHGMSPEEAQLHLQEIRPHINPGLHRREVVARFAERLGQRLLAAESENGEDEPAEKAD